MGPREAMRMAADGDGETLRQRLIRPERAKDVCALYIHFARAPQFQRRPDFLRFTRHAFLKQTASMRCDRFVLASGDMVIVGTADLPDRIGAPLGRACDLAAGAAPDDAAPPLISYFDLAGPEGVGGLSALLAAGDSPAQPPRRPLTPAEVNSICARMSHGGIADLIRTQTAVSLAANDCRPLFREAFVAMDDLKRRFAADIDVSGRPLFRYLMEALDGHVLRNLPGLPNPRTDIPISLNLSLNTLSTPEFASFRRASPFPAPLLVEIQIVDVLSAPAAFERLRARLADADVMLIVDGIPLSTLDHVDVGPLRSAPSTAPAQVKILWDQRKDAGALQERMQVLRRAASRIGRDSLILARCDSEAAIACALGAGVCRVQGRLVERLLARRG